jgi:hypothetical protein
LAVEEVGAQGPGGEELAQVVDVERLVDDPCHLIPDLGAVTETDRLDEELTQRLALEGQLAEHVEDGPAQGLNLDGDLLEQASVDVTLAGPVSDEVPEVAGLGLADPVDPSEPLLDAIGVPRQVVVDHEVGALEIDPLPCRVGRDEDHDRRVVLEGALSSPALVARQAAVDRDDRLGTAEERADPLDEVVEGVAVFGEDDELAPAPRGVLHLGFVLEQPRELGPLRVGPELSDVGGERLEPTQRLDLQAQLGDRPRGGGEVDRGLLRLLLLLGGGLVVVDLLDVAEAQHGELRLGQLRLLALAGDLGLGERALEAREAALDRLVDGGR